MKRNEVIFLICIFPILILFVIFRIRIDSKEADKEMLYIYNIYSILNKNDHIEGVVTDIYQPNSYRYSGRHIDLTIDSWNRISIYISDDSSTGYGSIRRLTKIGDSLIKPKNSENFIIKKKNTNEYINYRLDSLYAKEMTDDFRQQNSTVDNK